MKGGGIMFVFGATAVVVIVVAVFLVTLRAVGGGANPALVMGMGALFEAAGAVAVFSRGELSQPLGIALVAAGLLTGISAVATDSKARARQPLARHE